MRGFMRDHRGTGLKRVRFECRIKGRHARSLSLARVIIRAQILLQLIKTYVCDGLYSNHRQCFRRYFANIEFDRQQIDQEI